MTIGIVYDDCFKNHEAQYDHPECPNRLDAIVSGLKSSHVWDAAAHISPQIATMDQLTTVHHPAYIETMLAKIDGHNGNLDRDTFFSTGSKEAALRAAGGATELAMRVHRRELDWGFAAVRPPGHHAESNRACGFCLINNIAVAAGTLLAQNLADRVAIVDWDVHHGNGSQEQFYSNPNVLFISIHQWPHFPGSGQSTEIGAAEGLGRTINFPFPGGMEDSAYVCAFERVILPALKAFAPQHILVSAGFDAHISDHLAGINLSTSAFEYMTYSLKNVADIHCNGRISFYLEGGYNMHALEKCTVAVCRGMEQSIERFSPSSPHIEAQQIVESTLKNILPYWPNCF